MSYQSEKEEDQVFASLSPRERKLYEREYKERGGDVRGALDAVVGPRWFNSDGSPRGTRNGPNPEKDDR